MKNRELFVGLITLFVFMMPACNTAQQKTSPEAVNEKQVAMLVGEGFHDGEAYMPIGFLTNRNVKVVVIGPEKGAVKAYNSDFLINIEYAVDEVTVDDFDALIIPGGMAPSLLRENENVVDFARDFFNTGKPTAAICHGPQILITAGVMAGKKSTAVGSVGEELIEAGAEFYDQALVIDGNLITSRVPRDLNEFSRAILEALDQ